MGGHIDAYLDCVSPYSYMAILYLLKNRDLLGSYGIDVEFHPVFLGGINVGSGNKPPWTLPAKAKYGSFDSDRSRRYHGVPELTPPPFFPILSLTPQRAMCYIKTNYPSAVFETAFLSLWPAMWTVPHQDVSDTTVLAAVLSDIPKSVVEKPHTATTVYSRRRAGEEPLFTEAQIAEIVQATKDPKFKEMLNAKTQKALDLGAFGAPWIWVRNAEGKEQPFFGSDRFHYMWQFLGVPFRDIEIVPKGQGEKAKL